MALRKAKYDMDWFQSVPFWQAESMKVGSTAFAHLQTKGESKTEKTDLCLNQDLLDLKMDFVSFVLKVLTVAMKSLKRRRCLMCMSIRF